MCELKKCSSCEKEKTLSEFYKRRETLTGLDYRCKICKNNKIANPKFIKHPYNKEIIQEIADNIYANNVEVISEYEGHNKHLVVRHRVCGKEWKILLGNLQKGRGCPYCSVRNKSSLSTTIEKFLVENDICFLTEYVFRDCVNLRPLPFDFAIFSNEVLVFLIEADGEQHFKNTGFSKGGLEEVIKRDSIKDKYCEDNNIKLIRINYLQEKEVEQILIEKIKTLKCNCTNEKREYYTKSIITEVLAKDIRILYLKEGESIKSLKRTFNISESVITKTLDYVYYPDIEACLKEDVKNKRFSTKRKNRDFRELTKEDIILAIEMKKENKTDIFIGEHFGVNRKSFSNFIEGWKKLKNR